MEKPSVAIVGAGKVGTALAVLLKENGYPIIGISSRSPASAKAAAEKVDSEVVICPEEITRKAGLVFITTPDREIGNVDGVIGRNGGYKPGQVVAHTSGSEPAEILVSARKAGAAVVSIHPLQSFADVRMAIHNLPGSYFALEGDREAMSLAEKIVMDLRGKKFTISKKDKVLYHAAACIASNYLVSLMHFSTGLYERFGLSRQQAFEALYPLIQGTLNNIGQVGTINALTGPISRGDAPTVAKHLINFAKCEPLEKDLYRLLGQYTVKIALEKGSINKLQASELYRYLKEDI
ncbi:Rossmann-like and DUF2520 domain-containing protein [Desulfolucanica intricata]|uniref:Rossmann-like and DUF2520 domain-containing protein n=1 Tax=Desulfolucanica intricata TaxID=1285191 RepID=UPI00083635D9|nr:Rossmann-like and DUF2520 domain-containing protein [Desulfolucanica intricata]